MDNIELLKQELEKDIRNKIKEEKRTYKKQWFDNLSEDRKKNYLEYQSSYNKTHKYIKKKSYCNVCNKEYANMFLHLSKKIHLENLEKSDLQEEIKENQKEFFNTHQHNYQKGYCSICKKEFANLPQHNKSRRHLNKVMN